MTTNDIPPLDRHRFDATFEKQSNKIIWTAGGIAQRLGCGEDYVRRTLAHLPGTPIRKKGGRIYVLEDDLIAFMRNQSAS